MKELNNLFWFGKKELTQDAVLMWIFKNYDEDDLKDVARDLIGYFSLGRELKENEVIQNLRGKLQYKGVDVAIEYYLKSDTDEGWYYLIIEDKTYSYIHSNQIKKYLENAFKEFDDDWHIENRKNTKIKLIYFKLSCLNQYDKEEPIREAENISKEYKNRKNSIFDYLKDIKIVDLSIFRSIITKYLSSTNPILKEYALYIEDKYNTMLAGLGKKSNEDVTKFFIGYPDVWKDEQDERKNECSFTFFGYLFKQFEEKYLGRSDFWWTEYNYYFLKVNKIDSSHQNLPIIEIRSRDFVYDLNTNKVKIEVHLANYTSFFDEIYKNNKEEYTRVTKIWARYLKEKYSYNKILEIFRYEPSSQKENQRQLGKIIYVKEGVMSYLELIDILNKLIELQELLDKELAEIAMINLN